MLFIELRGILPLQNRGNCGKKNVTKLQTSSDYCLQRVQSKLVHPEKIRYLPAFYRHSKIYGFTVWFGPDFFGHSVNFPDFYFRCCFCSTGPSMFDFATTKLSACSLTSSTHDWFLAAISISYTLTARQRRRSSWVVYLSYQKLKVITSTSDWWQRPAWFSVQLQHQIRTNGTNCSDVLLLLLVANKKWIPNIISHLPTKSHEKIRKPFPWKWHWNRVRKKYLDTVSWKSPFWGLCHLNIGRCEHMVTFEIGQSVNLSPF